METETFSLVGESQRKGTYVQDCGGRCHLKLGAVGIIWRGCESLELSIMEGYGLLKRE